MDKKVRAYKRSIIWLRIVVIVIAFSMIVPAFLSISQKAKYYNDPTRISYFHEKFKKIQNEDPLLCLFQSDCLKNQRISWNHHKVYGPIPSTIPNLYIIQVDEAYFVGAIIEDKHYEMLGGIDSEVDEQVASDIKDYVASHQIVEEELSYAYFLSPYLLKQGNVGDLTKVQFWLLGGSIIGGFMLLVGFLIAIQFHDKARAYRCYHALSLQNQRLANREICESSKVNGISFGEKVFYFQRKEKGAIHVLTYGSIIWCYYENGKIILYDQNKKKMMIKASRKDYEMLENRASNALFGYESKYEELCKSDFSKLISLVKQRHQERLKRFLFLYQDQAFYDDESIS